MSLRRPRIRSLALIVVLATIGIVGGYAVIPEPVVSNGSSFVTSAEQVTDPSAPGATRYVFRFVASGPITWGLSVRNALLVPVTIQGLHAGSTGTIALVTDEALHPDPDGSVAPEQFQAFSPIQLAPGEATFLAVTARFADCASAQSHGIPVPGSIQNDLLLDVTVLGIPRVAHVGIPVGLAYDPPREGTCTAANRSVTAATRATAGRPWVGTVKT